MLPPISFLHINSVIVQKRNLIQFLTSYTGNDKGLFYMFFIIYQLSLKVLYFD